MKKIALLIILVIIAAVSFTGCFGVITSSSWSGTSLSDEATENDWSISAQSLNGNTSRNVDFTAETLKSLYIKSENTAGTVTFTLKQGDKTETSDISGNFDGNVNTEGFEPGNIEIRLEYESAEGVNTYINW